MEPQNQLTPYACGLACVEWATHELGCPITQCEMLVRYKDLLLRSVENRYDFGSAGGDVMQQIWTDQGLSGDWFKWKNVERLRDLILAPNRPSEVILISFSQFMNKEKHVHCGRFVRLSNRDEAEILFPSFFEVKPVTQRVLLHQFLEWDYACATVRRRT